MQERVRGIERESERKGERERKKKGERAMLAALRGLALESPRAELQPG